MRAYTSLVAVALAYFSVEDGVIGHGPDALKTRVLRNHHTGELVEVIPELGGKTQDLLLKDPVTTVLRPVLMTSRGNATDIRANTGWAGAMLLPFANRIKNGSYTVNGKKFYMDRNEDRGAWGYGKEALHGFLEGKQMREVEHSSGTEEAVLVLAYDFNGEDPGYPFELSVQLKYILSGKGLAVATTAKNRAVSGGPLPFYNSWHSYFAVPEIAQATVELDRCSGWNHISVTNGSNLYSDLIPTGQTTPFKGLDGTSPIGGTREAPTYYDDEFKATASTAECPYLTVKVKQTGVASSVLWMDSSFRWVQIYTGTKINMGRQAIAVEAMSGQCDSWNNMQGVRLLQAGESWSGMFGVTLEGMHALV
mmetsp:Transcript_23766/g.52298  ORF Transcript_23766/g.52298 Transcript_23766/m.52298 type:complete len:365 (-) Transcript_23766:97-1191(-)|eukprot:CAMPEP_0204319148 /NCGR_PEP_ID=MMETSP0469-20131031/6937_1 /ASSEMBLY_ACC=CAM_ASM_000384 /TAXON_ID=2969 /ORGANISM="Oxyrrhis marina" /LENGTH=364 /DNA_ID=CAMNT_0051300291 /DNA_START=27 /DNA_END=1121 /DNA_ORIENTATION=+